jgi:hypothetical protein
MMNNGCKLHPDSVQQERRRTRINGNKEPQVKAPKPNPERCNMSQFTKKTITAVALAASAIATLPPPRDG